MIFTMLLLKEKKYVKQISIQSKKLAMFLKCLYKDSIATTYDKREKINRFNITKPYEYKGNKPKLFYEFKFDHPCKEELIPQYPSNYFTSNDKK